MLHALQGDLLDGLGKLIVLSAKQQASRGKRLLKAVKFLVNGLTLFLTP
jgi:hypothetical protein